MVQYANRMSLLKGSEIRELLALTSKPDIISFAGGMPAPELFPCEGVKQACIKVMDEVGQVALHIAVNIEHLSFYLLSQQISEIDDRCGFSAAAF